MNIRLKILSVLLGIVYLYIIGEVIVKSMVPLISTNIQETMADKKKRKEPNIFPNTYYFYVKPDAGHYTYPDKILNLKSRKFVQSEIPSFSVKTTDIQKLPNWISAGKIIMIFVSSFLLFLMIFILIFQLLL